MLFFASSPSLPWQHGRSQQGWYIRETLTKQFTKPTPQFILGSSNSLLVSCILHFELLIQPGPERGILDWATAPSICTKAARNQPIHFRISQTAQTMSPRPISRMREDGTDNHLPLLGCHHCIPSPKDNLTLTM